MKDDWLAAFAGRTVVVIASGPSLTPADCEMVRASGLPTFVTNTTFRACPWADVLVAHDSKWWTEYRSEVAETFRGFRFHARPGGTSGDVRLPPRLQMRYQTFNNSGCAAITLAALVGAKRVVLLGADCQFTGGKSHHHGDHPPGLGNAKTVDRWPTRFSAAGKYAKAKGCEVVNASRETALTCFQRVGLEDELESACK